MKSDKVNKDLVSQVLIESMRWKNKLKNFKMDFPSFVLLVYIIERLYTIEQRRDFMWGKLNGGVLYVHIYKYNRVYICIYRWNLETEYSGERKIQIEWGKWSTYIHLYLYSLTIYKKNKKEQEEP